MSLTIRLWIVIAIFVGGCSSLPPLPPPESAPAIPVLRPASAPADAAYTIGPEDVLSIDVYDHGDLSMKVTVSSDGSFRYPLLGTVEAVGLTTRQLESRMTRQLSEYVVNPQVRVGIAEFQSQQVYIVGEVSKPGAYVLKHASTLLEVLSRAGGPTSDAGWEVALVRARQGGNGAGMVRSNGTGTIWVDLEQLMAGVIPQPIQVQSGDTIYVPKAAFFYVHGEIERPGRYQLERGITVTKAITVAGGFSKFAAKGRLKVRRLVNGQPREFSVQMTDPLQAGDVLIVPESAF